MKKIGILVLCLVVTAAAATLKDGVYAGKSNGYEGTLRVAVTVEDGKIHQVEVTHHRESRPRNAVHEIPARIVRKNSVKVDAVSGATITSDAIMRAVKKALRDAQ